MPAGKRVKWTKKDKTHLLHIHETTWNYRTSNPSTAKATSSVITVYYNVYNRHFPVLSTDCYFLSVPSCKRGCKMWVAFRQMDKQAARMNKCWTDRWINTDTINLLEAWRGSERLVGPLWWEASRSAFPRKGDRLLGRDNRRCGLGWFVIWRRPVNWNTDRRVKRS